MRFYWFPLSSLLSPLVPRGERMESLKQPWVLRTARDESEIQELTKPGPQSQSFAIHTDEGVACGHDGGYKLKEGFRGRFTRTEFRVC